MGRGGKGGHVRAGLGDDDVCDRPANPRDAGEQISGDVHGVDLLLDPLLEQKIAAVCWSILLSRSWVMKAWCSVKRPVKASARSAALTFNPPLSSTRAAGSVTPDINAVRIRRLATPQRSVTTLDSLIWASSRSFSKKLHLPGAVPGNGGSGPGQVAEYTDRRRRYQRGSNQPIRAEVS